MNKWNKLTPIVSFICILSHVQSEIIFHSNTSQHPHSTEQVGLLDVDYLGPAFMQ